MTLKWSCKIKVQSAPGLFRSVPHVVERAAGGVCCWWSVLLVECAGGGVCYWWSVLLVECAAGGVCCWG